MSKMNISLVIPAYNEEKRIGRTLSAYSGFFESLRKNNILDYNILVSINNTTDNTENIIKSFEKKNKRINHMNLPGRGKGYAILEGFKECLSRKKEIIGFVDADLATPPESFYSLVKAIDKCDVAMASRAHPESIVKTSLKRKIFNRGFNFGVRSALQLPYKDTQCGAKLFTMGAAREMIRNPPISQWAFDVELIYNLKKKGFSIMEVPTIWIDKTHSKINLKKVPFQMFSAVVRLRLLNSPLKFIVDAYDRLPEKIKMQRF